jgi:hypothetical protein
MAIAYHCPLYISCVGMQGLAFWADHFLSILSSFSSIHSVGIPPKPKPNVFAIYVYSECN